jgi:hypothetical protein
MGTSKSRITAKAHKHYFCQNQQASYVFPSPSYYTWNRFADKNIQRQGLIFILWGLLIVRK